MFTMANTAHDYVIISATACSSHYANQNKSLTLGRNPGFKTDYMQIVRNGNKFDGHVSKLWKFMILDEERPIGYIRPEFVYEIDWSYTSFDVCFTSHTVHLNPKFTTCEDPRHVCKRQFVKLLEANRSKINGCLGRWTDTKSSFFPINMQESRLVGMVIPVPMRGIFGIVTYGVHLNVYTTQNTGGKEVRSVWVSKRSEKAAFPGKLDQCVAGGCDSVAPLDMLEDLRRECYEEAGLFFDKNTMALWSKDRRIGVVKGPRRISFYDQKNQQSGRESGHLEPGVRSVFDVEVPPDFVPSTSKDDGISCFLLKSVDQVAEDLKNDEWKPNSGLAMLCSLLHANLLPVSEEEAQMLHAGLQRRLPFQTL